MTAVNAKVNISHLSKMETFSFGILVSKPGDLAEAACEIKNGKCIISHLGSFYSDVIMGNKKIFLNYNGKEYSLPKINNSSDKKDYQLINGVWTQYK